MPQFVLCAVLGAAQPDSRRKRGGSFHRTDQHHRVVRRIFWPQGRGHAQHANRKWQGRSLLHAGMFSDDRIAADVLTHQKWIPFPKLISKTLVPLASLSASYSRAIND